MDLAIVKERIDADGYENPQEFCDDIRLLVSNSKQYNTNKKSRVSVILHLAVNLMLICLAICYTYSSNLTKKTHWHQSNIC